MKNKKIVFFVLNIYQIGGIEKVVSIIANMLCEKFDITIVSLFKTNANPIFELDKKISVINILNKPINLRMNYFYIKNKIKKKMNLINCDFFINCGMGYVPFTIFMKKKAKYISWEHSNCKIGKRFGITWLGRVISKKYADYIVFLTKRDLKNYILKFKCTNTEKLIQIYNPINLQIKPNKYDSNSKKIISCGRLEYQKGFDLLLQVAKSVFEKQSATDWSWDIYGDGTLRKELQEKIKELGLEKHVELKGNVTNMDEVYSKYALFVLTSRYEGFCLVNIEASTNLLPIVSFNCDCGPDEIILHNVNGYIIDDFNIDEMANKILDLIENNEKRITFSNNALVDKEKLKNEEIYIRWEELLRKCGESI